MIEWPMTTGSSLLLLLWDPRGTCDDHFSELVAIARSFGVDAGLASQHAEPMVQPGLSTTEWLSAQHSLVFRCPRTAPVWEAAPLLDPWLRSPEQQRAAQRLLVEIAEAALRSFSGVGFMAAHSWETSDRPFYFDGSVGDLERYVASPDAWRVLRLGTGNRFLVKPDGELPVFFRVMPDPVG